MPISLPMLTAFPDIQVLLSSLSNNKNCRTSLISLCGAGGKTSTLFWLADYFHRQGKRVLITTTTHMFLPAPSQYRQLLIESDPKAQLAWCQAQAEQGGILALFSRFEAASGKVAGLMPEQIDRLKGLQLFDLILVEADGAQRKLLKVPAPHEPCIPTDSDWVIALCGGAMLGAPAEPERIHRWPQLRALSGIEAGEPLDWPLFDTLLGHPHGLFKGAPTGARRIWLINGDYQNEASWQPELMRLLARHPEIEAIWQGAVREPVAIRHALSQALRH